MKFIWFDYIIIFFNYFGFSVLFFFYDEEWELLGFIWFIEIDGIIVIGYFLDILFFFGF